MSKPPGFERWRGIIRRCNDPAHADYALYGGRGIKVCERWQNSFAAFLADMGPRPSPKHSIDRVDNDGNYEPGNCCWATPTEQALNRRPANGKLVGATYRKNRGNWRAAIWVKGRKIYLGSFATKEEAAAVYFQAAEQRNRAVEAERRVRNTAVFCGNG